MKIFSPILALLIISQIGCKSQQNLGSVTSSNSQSSVGQSNVSVLAKVQILDNLGAPVSGATVSGTWAGVISGPSSAVTASDGYASLSSPKSQMAGTYTLVITGVSKPGFTYNPANNKLSQASISR